MNYFHHSLKQSGFVVTLVNFVRAMRPTWQQKAHEFAQTRQMAESKAENQKKIDAYLNTHEVRKLQIGTGGNPLPGWLNTDLEPTAAEVAYLDATKPFPMKDESFSSVFSEHMIEHITYKDGLFMLQEVYRVLKPGGKVRIATPDIKQIIALYTPVKNEAQKQYLTWSAKEHMGLYSPEKSPLQKHRREWDLAHEHITRFFPDPAQDSACFVVNNFFRSYGHLFLYDEQTLAAALAAAGFTDVVRCQPGESGDDALSGLESHGTLIGEDNNRYETLILEATRT